MSALGLGDELGEEDSEDDLLLASVRDGGPGVEGLHGREGLEGDVLGGGEHAGEMEAGALDEVASGGKHGASSVLELGGTEPGKSGLRPKIGKAKGIEGLEGHRGTGHVIKAGGKGHRAGTLNVGNKKIMTRARVRKISRNDMMKMTEPIEGHRPKRHTC